MEDVMEDPCAKLLRNSTRDFKSVFCCLPPIADLKDEDQDVLKLSNIFSIEEQALDIETMKKQPGMIGYIRRDGEDLWDVAKKYHASTDNMIEIGNKILVVKQIL